MKKQDYQHHKKYYPPHHFIFLPLMLICIIVGVKNALQESDQQLTWILFTVLSFSIFYLAIMLRQHYALGNQDRIVRLEFRLRHFELLGKSSLEAEKQLSFSQIAALRFCSDEEFADLLHKSIAENLSADEIKKSIKHWQADNMRL